MNLPCPLIFKMLGLAKGRLTQCSIGAYAGLSQTSLPFFGAAWSNFKFRPLYEKLDPSLGFLPICGFYARGEINRTLMFRTLSREKMDMCLTLSCYTSSILMKDSSFNAKDWTPYLVDSSSSLASIPWGMEIGTPCYLMEFRSGYALCAYQGRFASSWGSLASTQSWKKPTWSARYAMSRTDLPSSSGTGHNSGMYLTTVFLFYKKGEGFILESPTAITTALSDEEKGHTKGLDRRAVPMRRRVLCFAC